MSETETSKSRVAQAANLFDLRRIIGGVFVVYGLLLAILGLFDSQQEIDKSAGVNINLWAGLGMLVFGVLMIVWALTRPLADEFVAAEEGGPMDAPPPRGVDAAALGSDQRRGRPGHYGERPAGPDDPRPE
jgi:hypothetical protein